MRTLNSFLFSCLISPALLLACGSSNSGDLRGGGDGGGPDGGDETGGAGGDGGGSSGGTGGAPPTGGTGGMGTGGATAGTGGAMGGSGGTTGDGGQDAGPVTCDDLDCEAPATCEEDDGGARCVCPEGYEDPNGDGSECVKNNGETCDDGTECASGFCVAGTCCAVACDSPGPCQQSSGTVCVNGTTCQYGKLPDDTECDDDNACTSQEACVDGECLGVEKDCSDDNQCTVDTCDPASGECIHTDIDPAVECDDKNPCTSDVCNPATGCRNPPDNTATCSDGDPCTDDVCTGGVCVTTAVDCSGEDDDCNEGVCHEGSCVPQPANEGGACSQSLGACDATGTCDAGVCEGNGDACGDLAAACAPCSGGADCFQGRLCTCETPPQNQPPIDVVNGVCVQETDECLGDPCDAIAVACHDPTPDGSVDGDVQCTCPDGYSGNGVGSNGCVDIDECDGANPCGAGNGTCVNQPGGYDCTCNAGYAKIAGANGPICRCDLSGSYAYVATNVVSWDNIGFGLIEDPPGEGVKIYSWALRQQTIESDGTLTVKTVPCGGTSPTLCSAIQGDAYAQFQPTYAWGNPEMYSSDLAATLKTGFPTVTVNLRNVRPGGTYVESPAAVLQGIALDNPFGPWPPCAACVGTPAGETCMCGTTQHTITNGSAWVNSDGDSGPGVTTLAVPPGGILIDGGAIDPPVNYASPDECPRLGGIISNYDYASWPGLAETIFAADEWFGAARVISQSRDSSIEFTDNACVISGTITGPNGTGFPVLDARIGDCSLVGQAAESCSAAQASFYDTQPQTQEFVAANFDLHPLAGKVSFDLAAILAKDDDDPEKAEAIVNACAEVRALYCPDGMSCE